MALQPPFPQEVEIFTEGDWWEGQIESRDGNKSVTVSFKGGDEDMNIIIKAKEWSDRLASNLEAAVPGTRAQDQTKNHPSHIPAESGPDQHRDPSSQQISEQSEMD